MSRPKKNATIKQEIKKNNTESDEDSGAESLPSMDENEDD